MHLLAATPGNIDDGIEPVDPDQAPADIVFISAADSELAMLAAARRQIKNHQTPGLRLLNLAFLRHPYSVDLYLEKTASKARIVVVRLLGGLPYWQYGAEQFAKTLGEKNIQFILLPGDDKPDQDLQALSTVVGEDWLNLWAYLVEGSLDNAKGFLNYIEHLLDNKPRPVPPSPLLRAGCYWPEMGIIPADALRKKLKPDWPNVYIIFYRALLMGSEPEPIDTLVSALNKRSLNAVPVFVASLKDKLSASTLLNIAQGIKPDLLINTTSFAVSSASQEPGPTRFSPTILDQFGKPVLQAVMTGSSFEAFKASNRGLGARDIAMNIALPEVDGRIFSGISGFKEEEIYDEETMCSLAGHRSSPDHIAMIAGQAKAWTDLASTDTKQKNIAIILANYPNKDSRIANGVGLDTPNSVLTVLKALQDRGYRTETLPASAIEMMEILLAGPTNAVSGRDQKTAKATLCLDNYRAFFQQFDETIRREIVERWGEPEEDPHVIDGAFQLALSVSGGLYLGIQPARGYHIDPKESYHSPDLVPPHYYIAFYLYLREVARVKAVIHFGKHGNLEWLPGKAVGTGSSCYPGQILGSVPHLYPFIVNDPGEGTQAKRRTHAVILDHLTPPMTRAETYGDLRRLEALIDEYYEASGVDAKRIAWLRGEILSLLSHEGLGEDAGIREDDDTDSQLAKIDTYLCEIKEKQIRDGLHIFGQSPKGVQKRDLIIALMRNARPTGSFTLFEALARDLHLPSDLMERESNEPWQEVQPPVLKNLLSDPWRTIGDTIERLELLAIDILDQRQEPPGPKSLDIIQWIRRELEPLIDRTGEAEMAGLLKGLDGAFVEPGSSGAPTRGRLDVLPTGRNFYSVDTRAVPTRAAWHLGWFSASTLIERHLQDHGEWLTTVSMSAWGTANMRTGGDDIAQALALMGVRPRWDDASNRVTGFEILPLSVLGRPRVDVTLKISGFFRDAFPAQIDLFSSAAKAVMQLDETDEENPAAAKYRLECETLGAKAASYRIFGSKPGSYGAGLQAMIDERLWENRSDLASTFIEWGSYAYGQGEEGARAVDAFKTRLSGSAVVIHNQDNREHDLLDSDDYYQFEGGLTATIEHLSGRAPQVYHNDHSRPEKPVIRTLDEELSRVMRSRAVNPKWIEGVKRHGYKGAFEMAATLDYLFAFAATTNAVKNHHFDLLFKAYIADDDTRQFIAQHNHPALLDMAQRFREMLERQMWVPASNHATYMIEQILEQNNIETRKEGDHE